MAQTTATAWQPIGDTVAEFRAECGDLDHLVQSLFDQLEQMRVELDRKMREVERERERVALRERQLAEQRQETNRFAHQFEHQEAKLSETLSELEELKSLVRRAVDGSSQHDSIVESQLEKQLDLLMHERQSLQQQLAESQAELTRHASIARDLAAARQEIADLRSNRPSGEGSGSLVNVGQVSELEQERAALEAELELVRGRAAELYDTLSQERRAQSENRSETANELKQLRRIVEKQAELLSERVAVATAPSQREVSVADVADTPIEAAAASDPVINSVMAQFAKLQKEVAERRKHRK